MNFHENERIRRKKSALGVKKCAFVPNTPNWIITKPTWLEIRTVLVSPSNKLENLELEEREAIFLVEDLERTLF
jgi:hypothetical protein